MSHEERSLFWEVIVSVIFSKNMCSIPKGFRDRAMDVIARIKERKDALRRATHHVLKGAAKCNSVDDGIFEKVLYQVNCINFIS
jgi:hypothetical protein